MKIDLYTKTILTVIAACLIWISLTRATPVALAQTPRLQPTPVILVDQNGAPLESVRVSLTAQPLPVVVTNTQPIQVSSNSTFGVAVRSIERTGRWDPIQVQVLRDPPTLLPTP